ncbi:hypothetical protein T09_7824 [Trichinella sp. T9]|nr:hypothetical protein T09_7824 [Trichinella sp. T9]
MQSADICQILFTHTAACPSKKNLLEIADVHVAESSSDMPNSYGIHEQWVEYQNPNANGVRDGRAPFLMF